MANWYTYAKAFEGESSPGLTKLALLNRMPGWFEHYVPGAQPAREIGKRVLTYALLLLLSGASLAYVLSWASSKSADMGLDSEKITNAIVTLKDEHNLDEVKTLPDVEKKVALKPVEDAVAQKAEEISREVQPRAQEDVRTAPKSIMSEEDALTVAKAAWGETGVYGNNEPAVAGVVWVIINRRDFSQTDDSNTAYFSKQKTVDDVLRRGFYGVGNPQYVELEERLDSKKPFGNPNAEAKWQSLYGTIKKIAKGELPDNTESALFFDHLAIEPTETKILTEYGRKHFGVNKPPHKSIYAGDRYTKDGKKRVYLHLWK